MYDVVIVGGGPSGSALACRLAGKGLSVALCERKKAPGVPRKACGGGADATFFNWLPPDIDIAHLVRDHITELVVHANGREGRYPVPGRLVMTSREELDGYLFTQASSMGADTYLGVRVRGVEKDGGVYVVRGEVGLRCRVVVAADGVYSVVAKQFGLARPRTVYVGSDWMLKTPEHVVDRYRGKMTLRLCSLPGVGYYWVFPKGDHLSVGVGLPYHRAGRAQLMIQDFLVDEGIYGWPAALRSSWVPFVRPGARFVKDNVLAVGDAAGLVDPGSGAGLGSALWSAALAADAIVHYFGGEGSLIEYQSRVKGEILTEFKRAVALRNNILLWQALGNGAQNRWWPESLKVIAGGDSYLDLMGKHTGGYAIGRALQPAVELLVERHCRR